MQTQKKTIPPRLFKIPVKALFIGVYLLLFGLNLSAQNYQIEKTLTTEDGLPSNETYASFFDELGNLWILTDKGLVKYDGINIKTFSKNDGLPSQSVFKHYKDYKGRVWFSTNKGVFYLWKGEIFTPTFNSKLAKLASIKIINGIYVNKEDHLFLTLEKPGAGYFECDITSNKVVYHKLGLETSHMFYQIKRDIYHKYYFLSMENNVDLVGAAFQQKDSSLMDGFTSVPILLETAPPNYHRKLALAKNNLGEAKLLSVHTSLYAIEREGNNTISKKIRDFDSDILSVTIHQKLIYVSCRNSGVFVLNKSSYEIINTINIINVSDVHPISKSQFWLSTLDRGLLLVNTTFDNHFSIPKKFNINAVAKPIYFDANQLKLFYNKSFHFFQHDNNIFNEQTIYLPGLKRLPSRQRITWIGEDSAYFGNVIVNYRTGNLRERIDGIVGYSSLYQLKKGKYCLYGKEGFCFTDKAFKPFGNSTSFGFNSEVFDLTETEFSEALYLATESGIYRFLNDTLTPLFPNTPFTKVRMTCLSQKNNIMLIGSYGKGLGIYKNDVLTIIGTANGLSSGFIQKIKMVGDSIWVGTNKGIDLVYKTNTNSWAVHSNLLNSSVSDIYVINSDIYVQSASSFFKLSNLSKHEVIEPELVLTNVRTDKNIEGAAWDSNIQLINNQKSILIHFRLNELINSKRQEYIYQLSGLTDDWISTSERLLSFNNLPFGKYTLQIKGRSSSGQWSDVEELNFEVTPLFYQHKWFQPILFIFIGLAIGGIALMFQRERSKRYAQQNIMLKSSLSALKLQINPHFIFNALNSLQYLILSKNVRKSTDFLGKFSHLVRDVLDNSQKTYIALNEEINRLKTYVKLEEVRMESGDINFEIIEDKKLNSDKILIPNMLLQPLVENAIWHGVLHLNRDPRIILKYYTNSKEQLVLEIMDNGKGIDLKQLQAKQDTGSLAIKNIEERLFLFSTLEKKKFTIHFQATYPGTKVTITLPLKMTKK